MNYFSAACLGLALSFAWNTILTCPAWADDVTITIARKGSTAKPPFTGTRPAVDVAILLDTSNSMDGLIAQAKSQLWNIVGQFADAKKAGKTPVLRVSVFEYGNTNLPAAEGYIRQVVGLTDDLDKVSEALFALQTNGGDEYCGMVIAEAIKRLDWSGEPNSYKAIFVAGNEPFTQGSVNYKDSCKAAIERGIVVNTIHCGEYNVGVSTGWQHGAELAEGTYMNINQDRKVVHIECPQDEIIIKLNAELNKTYLWYGSKNNRDSYKQNQLAQDANALRVSGRGGFGGGRIQTKISSVYRNTGRDLIDSLQQDAALLSKVATEELPEAMQNMSPVQRKAFVQTMAQKRAKIKSEIGRLSREREAFLADKRGELAAANSDTLGHVISDAVRNQLETAGFDLSK